VRRIRLPISWVLVIVFTGLISLTAGVITWRLYIAAEASTGDTLRSMGENQLAALSKAVEAELRPAEEQAGFIGEYIASGRVDINDDHRIEDLLLGSLAASPQLIAVAFIRSDMKAISAGRNVNGQLFATEVGDANTDGLLHLAYEKGSVLKEAAWDEPVYAADMKITGLPLLTPLHKDGKLIGVIGALISTQTLARHVIERFVDPRIAAYVLMNDGMVLVHPSIANGLFQPSEKTLLPMPAAIGDPLLAAFHPERGDDPSLHPNQVTDFKVQKGEALGLTTYFLFKDMQVVGQKPWTGVLMLRGSDVDQLFERLNMALLLSLAVWAFGCFCAFALGRMVGRPINNLATAARHLSVLDFKQAQPLERSRLTEIDVAAEAYNNMRAGLGWFETYVPRSLVPLLMRAENADSFESREREISVLFTDIVGFTKIAERLDAPALARFLNRHFAILGSAVNAQDGTIDKYIGDSIMAFWGAPMLQADHAERAVRAAMEMGRLLQADNARRAKKGLKPIRIRIGIHCGMALAGNIGAPGRINYTLVGDNVNVAQRLEQFGKKVDDGRGDAVIIASADIVDRVPDIERKALGEQVLPGRSEPTEVFRLG
jgi:adenylate cyclase